jgi:alkylation response protein AidB-like acyl-CoA dehydrogenase
MLSRADTGEQAAFRDLVRTFLAKEVEPHHRAWELVGQVDRDIWTTAGELGLLGLDVPERFGGGGIDDFGYHAILNSEIVAAGAMGLGFTLHNDVVAPYLVDLAGPEAQDRWLPSFCSGAAITAIAMTEPGTGSDLRGIRTQAHPVDGGWTISGSKTFITNGGMADLVIVVARTSEQGLSLFLVPAESPGFSRGRKLEKIGLPAQDTAELFFDDVFVPHSAVLGEIGGGLSYLKSNLPRERLSISVRAIAAARRAVELTVDYCRTRRAFGQRIADFQATRFALAEAATLVDVGAQYVRAQIDALNAGTLTAVDAAMGKYWTTDVETRVADTCLQLHGGYGYMREQPIAQLFLDSRVQPIYGGTNEIMKEIIGRDLLG